MIGKLNDRWKQTGRVRAGDSSIAFHAHPDHIYRILADDGRLCAMSLPTMGTDGVLVMQERFVPFRTATAVGVDPVSRDIRKLL